MDVELVKVDGRQYRKQAVNMALYSRGSGGTNHRKPESSTRQERDEAANDDEIDCTIQKTNDGLFVIKMDVDPECYRFIVGRSGETKKRLQEETGTTITIPQKFEKDHGITISAAFEKAVLNARAKIQEIVDAAADKLDFNYFISLPLNVETIQERVLAFHKAVPHLEPSILVKPTQLHFTVCMLKLYGKDAEETAKLHLASLQRSVYDLVGTRSTVVKLRGLRIMNDDPTKADVVYTEPTADTLEKVQALANYICQSFLKAGIARKVEPHVKLHCTLINTRYRKSSTETQTDDKNQQRIPIDASKLLVDFANFDFGEARIPCVDLSQRRHFDANGYYHQVSTLRLP